MIVNFVSIPRTGTNSIYKLLGGVDAETNHKSIRLTKDERFSFAVIREPLNRLMSWWKYHSNVNYDPTGEIYGSTFNEWVERDCPHHWTDEFCIDRGITNPLHQWEFICDSNYDRIMVDKLIDFKNLNIEFAIALKPYLTDLQLPHINHAPEKPVSINGQLRKKIQTTFHKDFEIYEKIL